jgi:flagellar hook assembly protein FlgD
MPNPFSMSATVEFTLLNPAEVRLEIYDVAGRCVRTVVASPRPAGMYRALWDGRNAAGSPSPSGIYFWRLEAEGRSESQKILLVR